MISLHYYTCFSPQKNKNKIEKSDEIYNIITETTAKLTGIEHTKETAIKHSLGKLGLLRSTVKRSNSLTSTTRPANLTSSYLTANPNNIQQ